MELQKMFVTLAMKADEYKQGLNEAAKHAEGFRGKVGGMFDGILNKAKLAMAGVGLAIAAGFGLAIKSSIDVNAQLETTQLQFETLMGSAEDAEKHVAGLFEFAEKTPFETGPIIDASLKLQTFGGAALNTQENITLLGDAAAATNAPIDELGFWVGRLYGNLQAGQPFGEAAMRLQELAVMSPQARLEMERLQQSGASAQEVFAYFQKDLTKFTGAMDKQASTWQGMVSTVKDQISLLLADTLRPFFEEGREGLAAIIEKLNDPDIVAGIRAMGDELAKVAEVLGNVLGGILDVAASIGQDSENKAMMEALGFTAMEMRELYNEIGAIEGTGLFLSSEEDLRLAVAVNEALKERYAAELFIVDALNARSEAEDFAAEQQQRALELEERRQISAVALDEAMAANASGLVVAAQQSDFYAAQAARVWEAQNKARLETREYVDNLAAQDEAMLRAQQRAEEYGAAFRDMVDTYVTDLPRANEALASVNEETGALSVNVDGARQAIFDQLVQMGAAPEVISAYGVAIGVMTEAQAEAALKAAAVKVKIEELGDAIAGGMPVEDALADLDDFIYKLENGITPAAEAAALEVPKHIIEMKERIGEEARAAGEALMAGIQDGISEHEQAVIDAISGVATDTIDATKGVYQIESPSQVFAGIGRDLMAGLGAGLEEEKPGIVSQAEGIGQAVVDGIIAGINAAKEGLRSLLSGLADQIPDWLKQFLGIASPARVTVEIGQELVQGLVAGIQADGHYLESEVKTLSDNIILYFEAIVDDGDILNDWLSHLPEEMQPSVLLIGALMADGAEYVSAYFQQIYEDGDYLNDWLTHFPEELRPVVQDIGEIVAEGLEEVGEYIVGLDQIMGDVGSMLDFGDKASGLAGGFANHFQRLVTDPMREGIQALDDAIAGVGPLWEETMTKYRMVDTGKYTPNPYDDPFATVWERELIRKADPLADWTNPDEFLRAMTQMEELQWTLRQKGDWVGMMRVDDIVDQMWERNRLNEEYLEQQERLLALEKARADLDFLKQQMELLGLMAEHNVPLSALGGMELGLTADPGQLMDVMVAVMEKIVRDTQYELNNAFNQSPAVTSPTPGTDPSTVVNVQTQNINGGQHLYFHGDGESMLEVVEVLAR